MHFYYIDIVGTCNLSCPSCPTGNFRKSDYAGAVKPKGFMPIGRFDAILEKIAAEREGEPVRIFLYNWGEPLLHPLAHEFISRVNSRPTFRCAVSSNLSHRHLDLDKIIAAGPEMFRVSLSGFDQETYQRTHARGDIELVKANMRLLRVAADRHDAKTSIHVAYHVYRHNGGDEAANMASLCSELGFDFAPVFASFYPVEKLFRLFDGEALPAADENLIQSLVFSPAEALARAQPFKKEGCRLQDGQTAINFDGTVQLCCATFDPSNIIAPDFLNISAPDLMERKLTNETCNKCISSGMHQMLVYRGVPRPTVWASETV